MLMGMSRVRAAVCGLVIVCAISGGWAGEALDFQMLSWGLNEFSLSLYRAYSGGKDGNLLIGSLSVATAMSMAWAGAKGTTAEEIAFALGGDFSRKSFLETLGKLTAKQEQELNAGKNIWANACSVWVQQGFEVRADYKEIVERYFRSCVREADFKKEPEASRKLINSWGAEATRGMITEVIPEGAISPLTRVALLSATYFNARWAAEFPKENTRVAPFQKGPREQVPVPFMVRGGKYSYLLESRYEVVRLPYEGYRAAMLVVVPREFGDLPLIERTLTADLVDHWYANLSERLLEIWLPRFEISTWAGLSGALRECGVRAAFGQSADFSQMSSAQLHIDEVFHGAKLRVDEEGTEAAAVSSVMMQLTAAIPAHKPIVVRADRPFLIVILDEVNHCILFVGRVADPAER